MPAEIQLELRQGTASEWSSANPVLALAEPGLITDTGEVRTGDGSTAFDNLPDTQRFLSRDVLDGRYRNDDTPLRAGASEFEATAGSPVIVRVTNRWAAWALDDANTEEIAGAVTIPASWSTYDLEVWHTTSTGNSGNVRWATRVYGPSDGDALNTEDDLGVSTFAAVATADNLGVTTLRSGITPVSGVNLLYFQRAGGHSDDTLTGDVLILALVLRKAS